MTTKIGKILPQQHLGPRLAVNGEKQDNSAWHEEEEEKKKKKAMCVTGERHTYMHMHLHMHLHMHEPSYRSMLAMFQAMAIELDPNTHRFLSFCGVFGCKTIPH